MDVFRALQGKQGSEERWTVTGSSKRRHRRERNTQKKKESEESEDFTVYLIYSKLYSGRKGD